MKKALIALPVVALLAGVVFLSMKPRGETGTKVYTTVVEKGPVIASVRTTGVIAPAVRVNVSAEVSGKIERLYVKEGSQVKEGDLLLSLDSGPLQNEVERLEAGVRMSRLVVTEQDLAQKNAEVTLARRRELFAAGLLSREELERQELAVKTARATLSRFREQVSQAEAALEKGRDELEKTTIRSPLTGIVTELLAEEGESVVAGLMNNPGTVILVVSDMSSVNGEFLVDEHDVAAIEPGQKATVTVEALKETELEGIVAEIGHSAVRDRLQDVPTFTVKVKIEKLDPGLRPGMTARAVIETARKEEALSVPIQAVLKSDKEEEEKKGKQWVFVKKEGKAKKTEVVTGIADERKVEIVTGLTEGDIVVTGPYRKLKDLEDGAAIASKAKAKAKPGKKDRDEASHG